MGTRLPVEKQGPINIQDRKKEGLIITLNDKVQARKASTLFECVHLLHNALPEIDLDEVDASAKFLGSKFSAPIVIDSMTGGTPLATKINGRLAHAAEEFGLGMGVGSQRAGLKSSAMAETYKIVRNNAPNAFIFANIGGAQVAEGLAIKSLRNLIEMIDANALAVHLNPLQELIQPEGEPKFRGILERIRELSVELDVPIIVKEVGAGISADVAKNLEKNGVDAINVSGLGGTSWAGVEKIRASTKKVDVKANLGEIFWDWGIPTAASLIQVRNAVRLPLIASGGLRSGVDLVKGITLGATLGALAHPMLTHAAQSYSSLQKFVGETIHQIRGAMFLVGAKNIIQLTNVKYVISDPLRYWINE